MTGASPGARQALSGDVLVIGAGIAGMTAAKMLAESGRSVIVLEANDRVGGRTWSVDEVGGPVDYGGMFIGDTHSRSIALGESLGLEMTPSVKTGNDVYIVGGEVYTAPE